MMKYANEFIALWFMACCTYIVAVSDDSSVYIAFIGLLPGIAGLYKYMQDREVKRYGSDKQIPGSEK